ncbi:hypothetical protein BJY01DRAFT_241804 [Aspergillus pseudoustus]|uniref:Rhodopsin domain-containing protein n=1 Tax=Aspergillus pseudoustus TaxID=1810923 RepID=A0ABR4L1Q2_9EURO
MANATMIPLEPGPMPQGNSGPALMRGIWAGMAVAIVFVVLRVIAKLKIRHFRLDDVLMIAALILSIVSTVFLTISIRRGFGSNIRTKPLEDVQMVLKCIAIQWPLLTMSTTAARCSFIYYLLAILGSNKTHQMVLWVTLVLQLAANIVSAVLPTSICRNAAVLWDNRVETSCGDTAAVIKFSYFTCSLNSAVDLFLAVFATLVFWNLNLALRIKISLIGLLSLGIVAMIASIIKTTKLDEIPSITNLGASGGMSFFRWSYAENIIIIITSSIPCLRSLAISSVRKIQNSQEGRSYALTSWRFNNSRQTHTHTHTHPHSQSNNGAPPAYSAKQREPRGIYRKGQDSDSIERILDLEAPHETSNASSHAQFEKSGTRLGSPPPARLDSIRVTKEVDISYHEQNLR